MRVPPNNADAEKSVLGCMMQDREALSLAFELLTADDFYQPANREIFDAMHALNTQGMPIDLVTVDDELTRRGTLEGVGGTNYLIELSQCMPSTVNARAYVQIVDEKATLRRMIKATGDIASACYQQTEAVSDILGVAEKSIFDIIMRRHEGSTLTHIADVLPDTYLRIEQLTELKGGIDGVPTGFVDLDNLLTGLHGGELVIVGARPSMGKTAFVLSMARNMAIDHEKPVAFFSLEMSSVQLMMRLIVAESGLSSADVRSGKLTAEQWRHLEQTTRILPTAPLFIDDTPALSIYELRSKARRLKAQHDIQIIIIDYLQLMTGNADSRGNREQEVASISRGLKSIAKELNIPIIALSQLNRSIESRSGLKRPQLSDLRESGAIEQDADIVAFIHRPEYFGFTQDEDGNPTAGMAEIILAKHRNGATDTVKLRFRKEQARFLDYDDEAGTMIESSMNDDDYGSLSGAGAAEFDSDLNGGGSFGRPMRTFDEESPF